jgi:hypothetical protein
MSVSATSLLRRYGFHLFILMLLLFIWQQLDMLQSQPVFPLDDSYITLQNAQELLGSASAFGQPGALAGATSLIHTLLTTLLLAIVGNGLVALSLASFLGGWAFLAGVGELTRLFSRSLWVQLAMLPLAVFIAVTPYQLTNGLETSWAMAGVIWAAYFYYRDTLAATRWLCVLLGILPFLRPELLAFSGLVGLLLVYRHSQAGGELQTTFRFTLRSAGFALLGFAPFFLLLVWLTGDWVPNTISAKKYFFAHNCFTTDWKLTTLAESTLWLFNPWPLVLLCMTGLLRDDFGRVALLFTGVFYGVYYQEFVGALFHAEGRYQYIIMPLVLLGGLLWLPALKRLAVPKLPLIATLLATITVLFYSGAYGLAEANKARAFTVNEVMPVADWLNEHTDSNDTVLLHDVGYVGYAVTAPRLVDMVGLKTPEFVELHKEFTKGGCTEPSYLAFVEIYQRTQPQYLVVLNVWDQEFGISGTLLEAGVDLALRYGGRGYEYSIYEVIRQGSQ